MTHVVFSVSDIILTSSQVSNYDIILPLSAFCLCDEFIDLFYLLMNKKIGA